MIAERWDISREDMERFALASHQKAFAAIREALRRRDRRRRWVGVDETPRQTSLEKMAGCPRCHRAGG